jgi:DMSO/TMAO reductase YedYZ molybdopterin-dependent catalytic subunit
MNRVIRVSLLSTLSVALMIVGSRQKVALAQTAPTAAELRINGAVATPLVLTVADLKTMPRKKLSVVNPHDKKTEAYEGVLLEELLRKAGVPQGRVFAGP